MTDAIKRDVENVELFTGQDIRIFSFDTRQSTRLHTLAEELAAIGGPQAPGARSKASLAATELKCSFSKDQCELLAAYSNGLVCVLIFEGLQKITDGSPPNELPHLTSLENRYDVLCLAARNQILLNLVDNTSFAYDMDSILEFDDKVGFAARFNSYRFSVNDNASNFVKTAYAALCQGVSEATPVEYTLTQASAMIINNVRALHCRDVIKDNRRVLVRIFGLSKFSSPVVISEDPLLLQG